MDAYSMLTVKEMCAWLSTSPTTLRRLRAAGVLRAYRMRRELRFRAGEVLEALGKAADELPDRDKLIYSAGGKTPRGIYLTGKAQESDIIADEAVNEPEVDAD